MFRRSPSLGPRLIHPSTPSIMWPTTPGHDYRGRLFTTVGEEKRFNARLAGKTRDEFISIMNNLKLGACVFFSFLVLCFGSGCVVGLLRRGERTMDDGCVLSSPHPHLRLHVNPHRLPQED